ncbi:DUF4105 domain-containing protein [Bacteroidota bacterium]
MKKLLSSILIVLSIGILQTKSSDQVEISLLTCSSGKETFSAWGHSAIRVVDKNAKLDIVYNFGIFDFDTPNFYLKFIKGKLNYMLGAHQTLHFYQSYLNENRQITEQILNLSEEDEIKIIRRLEYLYRPENRYYLYSFVGKNCTSELRDLILENVETDFQNSLTNKTYRQQLNEFLQERLWLKFSMSLIMGYQVDRKIDLFQSMFLPDYLCFEIRNIKVNGEKIVREEKIYNQVYDSNNTYPLWANPLLIFSILFLIAVSFNKKIIQSSLLFFIGLTGLVVLFLSLITEHRELVYNLNLMWINPLYLIFAIFKFKNRIKLKKYILGILQLFLILMIPIWLFKIQYFELTYLPIVLILTIFNLRLLFPKNKLHFI